MFRVLGNFTSLLYRSSVIIRCINEAQVANIKIKWYGLTIYLSGNQIIV